MLDMREVSLELGSWGGWVSQAACKSNLQLDISSTNTSAEGGDPWAQPPCEMIALRLWCPDQDARHPPPSEPVQASCKHPHLQEVVVVLDLVVDGVRAVQRYRCEAAEGVEVRLSNRLLGGWRVTQAEPQVALRGENKNKEQSVMNTLHALQLPNHRHVPAVQHAGGWFEGWLGNSTAREGSSRGFMRTLS